MPMYSHLNGDEFRRPLGQKYLILPVGSEFECVWHRRHLDWNGIREQEALLGTAIVPCERHTSWWPSGIRAGALKDLPEGTLPDGRSIVGVPHVKQFGSVLPGECEQVKAAAKNARGPLMLHAYEVALERLQEWKRVGRRALERIEKREALIDSGELSGDPAIRLLGKDDELANWIYVHAGRLYVRARDGESALRAFEQDFGTLVPNVWARKALVAATGYTIAAIETMMRDHRAGPRRGRANRSHSSA